MNNKISIIVPVYNVEKYLSDCLESIIHQTYKNIEIILVNDGSTDISGAICDEYATKDNRIKVIHKKNGGLSDARNAGVKIMTGQFVTFVDSDDVISSRFCEIMLHNLFKYHAEIVECEFFKFDEVVKEHTNNKKKVEICGTEKALKHLILNDIKQIVCSKLYSRYVVDGVSFEVGRKHEDEFWIHQVLGKANKIIKISDILYFYRQHSESIMGVAYNITRLDGLLALEQRIKFMKKNFPQLENLAIKNFSLSSLWHYQQIERNPQIDSQKIVRRRIVTHVKKYKEFCVFKQWKLKEIVWYNFFLAAPELCVKFRNFINIGI